jgi:carboxymethylenebutenolidase
MKITFITLITFVLSLLAPKKPEPQNTTIPMCHAVSVSNGMAALASNPAFVTAHANPLPFHYVSAAGEMIQIDAPDGKKANAFFLKAKKPSNKWLFVYQEWWGLNDYIKHEAETYYNDLKDVNVIALDMYDGQVATKAEDAGKLMQGADKARLGAIMKAAIAYAGPKAEIASVGWCFGGGLSLQSAILEGKQAVGCVMYYGFPEMDVNKLKMLETDVLGLFGSKDGFISMEVLKKFEGAMGQAGEKLTVKTYEADHGFANPSNPHFDKAATEDAYKRALAYLKEKLKA